MLCMSLDNLFLFPEMSKRSYKSEFLKHGFTCIRSEGTEKSRCVLCLQVLLNELLKENKLKSHLH